MRCVVESEWAIPIDHKKISKSAFSQHFILANCLNSDFSEPAMKTIEIDDDVYTALLGRVTDFGETPNSVLRRELCLNGDGLSPTQDKVSPLQELLESPDYRFAKGAVGRFLEVLAWLYRKHRDSFSAVENIKGRGRIYFSQSEADLHASGKSVNPKKIPGSPYWVITTTPTNLKQEILSQVMKTLGYDLSARQLAMRAIAR